MDGYIKFEIELPELAPLLKRLNNEDDLDACQPALDWLVTQPDLLTAWSNCHRLDWIVWLLIKLDIMPSKLNLQTQLMVLETPLTNNRKVIDLITDPRSLTFIDLKRRRLNDEVISDKEWDNARRAAAATAAAAAAAATAATAATATADAYAAAYAADAYAAAAAYAADAYAAAAAAAATTAATAATATAATTDDAYAAARKFQVADFRKMVNIKIA